MPIHRLSIAFFLLATSLAGDLQVKPLLDTEGETGDPALSPDGKTLAFYWCGPSQSCALYTRGVEGGTPRVLVSEDARGGNAAGPVFSPDGSMIAFERVYSVFYRHVAVLRLSDGVERDLGVNCLSSLTWTPDSRFVLAGSPDSSGDCFPRLFSARTASQLRLGVRAPVAALSPDGHLLAFSGNKVLKLVRLTSARLPAGPPVTLATEPREITSIHWRPGSKEVFYKVQGDTPTLHAVLVDGAAKSRLMPRALWDFDIAGILPDGSAIATESVGEDALWQVELDDPHPSLERAPDNTDPLVSPDGRMTAYVDAPEGLAQIWLANADRSHPHPLVGAIPDFTNPHDHAAPNHLAWSPDGKWLLFSANTFRGNADTRSRLFVVPVTGGPPRRLATEFEEVSFPVWAQDGKSVFAAIDRNQLVRIDLQSGKATMVGQTGIWPQPSADGRYLYYFSGHPLTLSRVAVSGGEEERLTTESDFNWFAVACAPQYIYLFRELPGQADHAESELVRLDPETRQTRTVVRLPFNPHAAFLSVNGHRLYFSQPADHRQRVVLIRGF